MKFYWSILIQLSLAFTGFGNSYYLDPVNGNMTNDGSQNAPWGSLEEVIDAGFIASFAWSPLPYNTEDSSLVPKNPDGTIHGGDTLILLDGLHGEVFLQNYNSRLLDESPDVGAYEYIDPSGMEIPKFPTKIEVFPNPFHNDVSLLNPATNWVVEVYDLKGSKLFTGLANKLNSFANSLDPGTYILMVSNEKRQVIGAVKLIKY